MTSGATPRFSDDPYSQWIRERLEDLTWRKQDLAQAIFENAAGELTENGAHGVVHRATKGSKPTPENRERIEAVLGEPPPYLRQQAVERIDGLDRRMEELERRLRELEER